MTWQPGEAVDVFSSSINTFCRGEVTLVKDNEIHVHYWSESNLKRKTLPLNSPHIKSIKDAGPIRSKWTINTRVQAWSESNKRWFNAQITNISNENGNEMLTISWTVDNQLKMTKTLERESVYVRHFILSRDDLESNKSESFEELKNDNNKSFDISELIAVCLDLVTRTNSLISHIYEKGDLSVIDKAFGKNRKLTKEEELKAEDPTTIADIMAQKMIAGTLREKFKNLKICGEEGNLEYNSNDIISLDKLNCKLDNKYLECIPKEYKNINISELNVWIDPIDGTKEFTEGIKEAVTTLIGIARNGRPIIGFIGRPFTNELIWGVVGSKKVYGLKNEFSLKNRDTSRRIICTTRSHFETHMRSYVSGCKPSGFVRAGGSGGKVLMVVEGDADAYVFPSLGTKKWDTCGPEAILLALGGKLTKPDGTLYTYDKTDKKDYMNKEGFIATCFGDEYHNTFLAKNIMMEEIDLVLFGATGFTGKLGCEYIIEQYGKTDYSFGFAGRSMKKLELLIDDLLNSKLGKDNIKFINKIKLIECDALNFKSVENMVSKCSVVITTVGPYMRYGENLVKACCKWGVDYVDLTGEFIWIKHMINKYNEDAIRSSSRIINVGGFVSFPIDVCAYIGVKHLKETYNIKSSSEELIIKPYGKLRNVKGQSGGTTESTFNMIDSIGKIKIKNTDTYYLCDKPLLSQPKPKWPHYDINTKSYVYGIHYGQIDRMVISRTNELLDYYYGEKCRIEYTRITSNSSILAWIIALVLGFIELLLSFSFGRSFLKSLRNWLPKPGEGPTRKELEKASFESWCDVIAKDSNKKVRVKLSASGDPGYYNTSRMLVEQGMVMVDERNNSKIRKIKGGILTPAAALKNKAFERLKDVSNFKISIQEF